METITMSLKESDRINVLEKLISKRFTQKEATKVMGLSTKQVRQIMIKEGKRILKQKPEEVQRYMRTRKESYGEMIQYDGSYHIRFGGLESCLLIGVDDATGEITYGEFTINEGKEATFKFWDGYLRTNGKPKSIYLDKHSTYKVNHPNTTK